MGSKMQRIKSKCKEKQRRKKSKFKNQKRIKSMSSTPSLRSHHPKPCAMNAYLTKGLSK
jgi:hypothetical protein